MINILVISKKITIFAAIKSNNIKDNILINIKDNKIDNFMEKILITEKQKKRRKKDAKIYRELMQLLDNKENSKMEVYKYIMKRHNIATVNTLYRIIKRAESTAKS